MSYVHLFKLQIYMLKLFYRYDTNTWNKTFVHRISVFVLCLLQNSCQPWKTETCKWQVLLTLIYLTKIVIFLPEFDGSLYVLWLPPPKMDIKGIELKMALLPTINHLILNKNRFSFWKYQHEIHHLEHISIQGTVY